MMWKHDPGRFPPPPTFHGVPSVEDARRSQKESSRRFLEAAVEGPEIRRVSSEMREYRIRNGFEELIEDALASRKNGRR